MADAADQLCGPDRTDPLLIRLPLFGTKIRVAGYGDLRHHAATKWFHDELREPWEVVAQYLGDKLTTVLNHYGRAGEDALRDSVNRLASR